MELIAPDLQAPSTEAYKESAGDITAGMSSRVMMRTMPICQETCLPPRAAFWPSCNIMDVIWVRKFRAQVLAFAQPCDLSLNADLTRQVEICSVCFRMIIGSGVAVSLVA